MKSDDVVSVVLNASAIQGCILIVLFLQQKVKYDQSKIMLVLLLMLSIVATLLYNFTIHQPILPSRWQVFLDTVPFLFAPLFYLYSRSITTRQVSLRQKAFLTAFIPGVLHFFYGIYILHFSESDFLQLFKAGFFRQQWIVTFSMLVGVTGFFLIKTINILRKSEKMKQGNESLGSMFIYLKLSILLLICTYLTGWIYSLDYFFGIEIFPFTGSNLGWIVIPCFVYLISYFSFTGRHLSDPGSLRMIKRVGAEESDILKKRLELAMKEGKLYLDPQLKLKDLAQKISADVYKVSTVINQEFNGNFYDLVNRYRIIEFVEKCKREEYKRFTIYSLALDCGFNSKTTFNKSFRQIHQMSPSQYIKELQNKAKDDALKAHKELTGPSA